MSTEQLQVKARDEWYGSKELQRQYATPSFTGGSATSGSSVRNVGPTGACSILGRWLPASIEILARTVAAPAARRW